MTVSLENIQPSWEERPEQSIELQTRQKPQEMYESKSQEASKAAKELSPKLDAASKNVKGAATTGFNKLKSLFSIQVENKRVFRFSFEGTSRVLREYSQLEASKLKTMKMAYGRFLRPLISFAFEITLVSLKILFHLGKTFLKTVQKDYQLNEAKYTHSHVKETKRAAISSGRKLWIKVKAGTATTLKTVFMINLLKALWAEKHHLLTPILAAGQTAETMREGVKSSHIFRDWNNLVAEERNAYFDRFQFKEKAYRKEMEDIDPEELILDDKLLQEQIRIREKYKDLTVKAKEMMDESEKIREFDVGVIRSKASEAYKKVSRGEMTLDAAKNSLIKKANQILKDNLRKKKLYYAGEDETIRIQQEMYAQFPITREHAGNVDFVNNLKPSYPKIPKEMAEMRRQAKEAIELELHTKIFIDPKGYRLTSKLD